MSIVFLAISRTGPDPLRHDMFEVAAVHRTLVEGSAVERVHHWAIRPERLAGADPDELVRARFYDRVAGWDHNNAPVVALDPDSGKTAPSSHGGVARILARMLLGAQLATFGIDREAEFVGEFLRSQREPAGWVGHADVTSAAAGGLAGYCQGWAARGRADAMPSKASALDLAAALMPLDPFRLASALGTRPTGEAVSALVRAYLARDVWDVVTAPLRTGDAEGVSPIAASSASSLPPGVAPLAPVVDPRDPLGLGARPGDDGPMTGDVALDAVIRGIGRPLD